LKCVILKRGFLDLENVLIPLTGSVPRYIVTGAILHLEKSEHFSSGADPDMQVSA
jgi:hypothetical protein